MRASSLGATPLSQAGLDAIPQRAVLEISHFYHAMRGTFAAELGKRAAALVHFRRAESLATLQAEREFIAWRIEEYEGNEKG